MLNDLLKRFVRIRPSFPTKNQVFRYLAWSELKSVLDSRRINCVLDVGANKGQFAEGLRMIGYQGKIVSFEPSPDDFAIMARAFENDPLWKGFQYALGGDDKSTSFNITGDTRCNSILNPTANGQAVRTISVEMKQLDTLLDSLIAGIEDPRIFLKMDTQGYDLEVIKGAKNSLPRVLGLLSEIAVEASYEGMPLYLESLKLYEELGFHLRNIVEIAWKPENGSVMEMECLMVR